MPLINPETGAEHEVEANGDSTVTFEMTLSAPTQPDDDES